MRLEMLAKQEPGSDLKELLALRLSAGFCVALGAFFDWEIHQLQTYHDSKTVVCYLPYFLIVVHPGRWRIFAVGVSLGTPVGAAILSALASGFARTPEAHIPYQCFAAANLLISAVAFHECLRSRLFGRRLLWAFALAGFIFIWACAAI